MVDVQTMLAPVAPGSKDANRQKSFAVALNPMRTEDLERVRILREDELFDFLAEGVDYLLFSLSTLGSFSVFFVGT